jgi:hypothetical protein
MPSTRRVSMDEWAARVTAWQRSGKSAIEFGQSRGWRPARLRWWRWKLERVGAIPARREGLAPTPPTGRAPPAFLRLVTRDDGPGAPPATTAATARCELVLRDGRTLRFDDAVPPARLRALADALEVRP